MKFVELKKHLVANCLAAYLAVGEDDYLLKAAKQMFVGKIEFAEFNLSLFSDSQSPSEIITALEGLPVMSGKRLVIAENYKGDFAPFAKYLKNPNPGSTLLFVCSSLTSNFSSAPSKLEVIDCARLDNEMLKDWIGGSLKKNGGSISALGAEMLIDFCNRYLGRISVELEKLVAYKDGQMIMPEDVEALVHSDLEYKIFELSKAISLKKGERTAVLLNALAESGTPPVSLLGLLYAHFRRLLYCRLGSEELAKNLGVKEFAVKKAAEQARNFTPRRLKAICDSFHKADYDFKSGNMTDKTALETFIMQTLAKG